MVLKNYWFVKSWDISLINLKELFCHLLRCQKPEPEVLNVLQILVELFVQLAFCFCLCCVACRILVPRPGIEPAPLRWEHGVLTTGPPGSPLQLAFYSSLRVLEQSGENKPCLTQPLRPCLVPSSFPLCSRHTGPSLFLHTEHPPTRGLFPLLRFLFSHRSVWLTGSLLSVSVFSNDSKITVPQLPFPALFFLSAPITNILLILLPCLAYYSPSFPLECKFREGGDLCREQYLAPSRCSLCSEWMKIQTVYIRI